MLSCILMIFIHARSRDRSLHPFIIRLLVALVENGRVLISVALRLRIDNNLVLTFSNLLLHSGLFVTRVNNFVFGVHLVTLTSNVMVLSEESSLLELLVKELQILILLFHLHSEIVPFLLTSIIVDL